MKGRELYTGGEAAAAEAGCRFERQGRGDHEIWYSPLTRRRLMVDVKIKSGHWANHTLKQAGLPEGFLSGLSGGRPA